MRLGRLVKIKHGFAFKGEHFSDHGDYIVLTPGNIFPKGGLKLKGEKETYYTGDFPRAYILTKGDLVLVMTDLTQNALILGGAMLIDRSDLYLHNQRLGLVSHTDEVDRQFLYQYLNWQFFRDQVKASSNGATVKHTSPGRIYQCRISLPRSPIQKKIAAVLSTYDELIENNKRRIVLLDKLAEEIYREWFVRLRFPDHEKVKRLKGLPADWSMRTIGSLCTKVTDGAHASPAFVEGGKPMASVKDMRTHGFSLDSIKTISDRDFESLKKADCQPLKNDILIAKDGSYLKHAFVWDHDFEIVILSSIAILRPNLERVQPYFLAQLLKQDSIKAMMSGYVSGSALPRIILKDFKKMRLLLPSFGLIKEYEDVARPIFHSIHTAHRQNELLTATRDKLLPRLLSGKLSVENRDIQFPPGMAEELNNAPAATALA